MNHNELLAELHSTGSANEQGFAATEHVSVAKPAESDSVLQLDRWSRRRGQALSDQWWAFETDENAEKHASTLAADAHEALFAPNPVPAENPADKQRAAWFKQLSETPEYRSLRNQTVLDDFMAGLGAKSICDEWQAYAATQEDESEPQGGLDGLHGPGGEGEPVRKEIDRIRSINKAINKAKQEASDATDMATGMGYAEAVNGRLDTAQLAKALRRVKQSSVLPDIMRLAGRMIARCQSLQREKLTSRRGEITGVELAGDIGRLVPRELVLLAGAVPELQERAEMRLMRKRALCYKHSKQHPVGSGPILVSVDESGSMHGEKVIAAKALACALAWLARKQNRWCGLCAFSGDTGERLLRLPPGRCDDVALMDWMEPFIGGGSNRDIPVVEIPRYYHDLGAPAGKTDVIMITDAFVELDRYEVRNYRDWAKESKCKTYGIVIGHGYGSSGLGPLEEICDRCWCIPEIGLDTTAVEEVLSI